MVGADVPGRPQSRHFVAGATTALLALPLAAWAVSSAQLEREAAKETNRGAAAPLYLKAARQRVVEAKDLYAKKGGDELDLDAEDDELAPGGSATDKTRQLDGEALHYLQTAVDFDYGGKPLKADEWFAKASSVTGVSKATAEAIAKERARIDAERDPSDAPDPKPPKPPVYHQKLDAARAKLNAALAKYGDVTPKRNATKAEKAVLQELAGLWSEVGYQAALDFNPTLAAEALAAVEKLGCKPGHYAYFWTRIPEAYANLKAFPRDENATKTPKTLHDFGVKEGRTVVVGELDWDAEDATACVEEALASGATTVVFEDKGSPWFVRTIRPRENQRLVFKKGVKILQDRVSRQNRDKTSLIQLKDVRNVILEGEGGPGDVYIGQFELLAARKAGAKDYGGNGVVLSGARNCVIRNLTIAANANDGICLGGAAEVWVENVVLAENYRQAMSVCNARGLYCRKVVFRDTQGGAPECGIDFEPTYETEANADCYFYDCSFSGNRGGAVNWSSSSYFPVTAHFKRCHFGDQPLAVQIVLFARCGVYMEHNVRAPAKIVLEDLTMEAAEPKIPLQVSNANLFDLEVKGLKAKNSLPIVYSLKRDYSMFPFYDHAAHQARVTFADVALEGPAGQPMIEFQDKVGTYSVSGLSGTGTMNGEQVDFAQFAYRAPEQGLKEQPRLDALKLAAHAGTAVTSAARRPKDFMFIYSSAWFAGPISYRAVYFDDGWKAKRLLAGTSVADLGLEKFPVAYSARGGDSLFKLEGYGGKPFTVYFEAPPKGTPGTIKLHSWSARVRDAAGKVVKDIPRRESTTYVTCEASGDKGEIWSIDFDTAAIFKFFAPCTGLIAERPEDVPRQFQ